MDIMKGCSDRDRTLRFMLIVGTLLLSLNLLSPTTSASTYASLLEQPSAAITPPAVVLQEGTAGNSTIYANSTSAKVSVAAPSSAYDYVLSVVNQATSDLKINLRVYGSSNIGRLSNATISFHDGTLSDQIVVSDGNITQSQGALYNLAGNATICIEISNLQASTADTSYLYVYLKVLVPNTTTYSLYVITFEIT